MTTDNTRKIDLRPGAAHGFSAETLREPPSYLWPAYIWVLNDCFDVDKLLGQLRDMWDHDARSVQILPEPSVEYGDSLGSQMTVPYLGKNYMEVMRILVEECERLGMHFWLYDEGWCPSGGAVHQTAAQNPVRYAPKHAVYIEAPLVAGDRYSVPPDVLCAGVLTDGTWQVHMPREVIPAFDDDRTMRVYALQPDIIRGAVSPDVAWPGATETFIKLTHERYKRAIGGSFGSVIHLTFTDEPQLELRNPSKQLLWTEDMREVFQRDHGYDLIGVLPVLMAEPRDDEPVAATQARIDYYDTMSRLFAGRYLAPIREWCRASGLVSSGHLLCDHDPRLFQRGGYGHLLRANRMLDAPGIDMVGRHLYPGVRSHHYPKYASSAARQMAQPFVVTESFCFLGMGLTPAQMKWITDQQYVRGCSMLIHGCWPSSTRGRLMVGERPHFGPVNTLWDYRDIYHAYLAHLGYMLTRGQAVCQTAVYYDCRSLWAGGSTEEEAAALLEAIPETLLQTQRDFDFIDDDVLAGREGRIEDGQLVVGAMRYDTVVIPATRWMEAPALAGLQDFVQSGGRAIVVGDLPLTGGGEGDPWAGFAAGSGSLLRTDVDQLPGLIEPVVALSPDNPDIRACKRVSDGTAIYFLTNEANQPINVEVGFTESGQAIWCDLETGELYRLSTAKPQAAGTSVPLSFAPYGSALILFGVEASQVLEPFQPGGAEIPLQDGWQLRPLRQYRVGQDDFEITDLDSPAVAAEIGDWRQQLGEHFSGYAEYTVTFECPPDLVARPAELRLGQVCCACEVFVNGEPVGRRIWEPYSLSLTGRLQPGLNELRVVVTNTLANALVAPEVEANEHWKAVRAPDSRNVKLRGMDAIAARYEREDLDSGLCGPVTVVFGDGS